MHESRAVAGNPHVRCCCRIRYESKFTAASWSSPCDSMAFLHTDMLLTCLLLLQTIDVYYLDKNLLGWQVCFH